MQSIIRLIPDDLRRGLSTLAAACLLILPCTVRAASGGAGMVSGTVSNAATGNLLEGAKVEIPQLRATAVTDNTGRYVFASVPAGTHDMVVSYTGLDKQRLAVTVADGQRQTQNFGLTTEIYTMPELKITGEREGSAAAITLQRNAGNVKNVVAMDSFGILPNMSVGEVFARLPGVTAVPNEEGFYSRLNTRGITGTLNTVTIDGQLVPTGETNRNLELHNYSGTMFEAVELTKGLTPDMRADSIGGNTNLKTRSPLSMRENHRTTYNLSTRIAPAFTEQVPLREQHRAHPLLNLAHQQVFDIFGGQRNLGVAINLVYSENVNSTWITNRDFQNTVGSPAYLWDYTTQDLYSNRKQISSNLKAEYRLSPQTRLIFSMMQNYKLERHFRSYQTRAFSTQNQNTIPSATTSVIPGFTDKITQMRPVATSQIDMNETGPNAANLRLHQGYFRAEHDFGRLKIDYMGGVAQMHKNSGADLVAMSINNVGWILDRTRSDLHPTFTQAGGNDFTDPANWRPSTNGLRTTRTRDGEQDNQAEINVRYELATAVPTTVKAGFSWRQQYWYQFGSEKERRYSYIGTGPVPSNPSVTTYDQVKTGRRIPQWDVSMFMNDNHTPSTPSLWAEDLYFHEQLKYSRAGAAFEAVPAVYLMATGRFGREGRLGHTGYLAGIRREETNIDSWGYVQAGVPSTTAQRLADPVGAARQDYARRKQNASYAQSFPSAHVFSDLTPNLKARVSYSTSFGRPGPGELLPGESFNAVARTVTVRNSALKPQNARNWDATLEYYFEPVGVLSVAWFHKSIRDYIIRDVNVGTVRSGNDNGFDGQYAGFTQLTSGNSGRAVVQGLEFSYQQQLTFLPGLLKGLAVGFNYTKLDTHGMYNGTTYLTRRDLSGFIPFSANGSLSWRYRNFSTRVLYNVTSEFITSFDAANPARNLYQLPYKNWNIGFKYQLRPALGLTLDVINPFNSPLARYRGYKDRTSRTVLNFVNISAGVSGQF